MKSGEDTLRCHLENRAGPVGTAVKGRTVKGSVAVLQQAGKRASPVRVVKIDQHRQHASRGDLEDSAGGVSPAALRHPVKIAIAARNQAGMGTAPARLGELDERA